MVQYIQQRLSMEVESKRILIIEDDRFSAEYLSMILQEAGYEVIGIIASAEESIVQAKVLKPDLILMDIILRDTLTGCEAAVQIKQNQKDCKIVFLTAHAEAEMIDYAQQSQADAYLLKPYRDDEILATLAVIFSHDQNPQIKEIDSVKLSYGFSFNIKKRQLIKDGKHIPLTETKLKLVEYLAKNVDTTISSEQICQIIWGETRSNNTLRSLIFRIKQAVGVDLISNATGAGYVIKSA
jgi:DNA-binding response OmpR family regulator